MINEKDLTSQLDYNQYTNKAKGENFRTELRVFTREYIGKHTYIKPLNLTKDFIAHRTGSKRIYMESNNTILTRLSLRFSKLLNLYVKEGVLERYNKRQYKRVNGKVRNKGIKEAKARQEEIEKSFSPSTRIKLVYIDGKFRNPNLI
jgi:hypothetical protein